MFCNSVIWIKIRCYSHAYATDCMLFREHTIQLVLENFCYEQIVKCKLEDQKFALKQVILIINLRVIRNQKFICQKAKR